MSEHSGQAGHDHQSGRGALSLPPGHTVMEYAIERTLGGGGFGITYLARDLNLSLLVALKEYLPADLAVRAADGKVEPLGTASEPEFMWGLERFIDEARALATFNHPNIVRVLRYFAVNGTAYIVMEYQSGHNLKQWLPRHTPIGRGDLLKIVLPLLDGLEMVHQAGFLHRDIKPDNIFVRGDGSPVLIDFGAARRTAAGQDLTKIISPGFAPFEQYHSKGNQGPWTDLYSLAAVMYWVISGNKPMESASRLKRDDMVPATQSDPHNLIGEPILSAIDWALCLDEEKRPQSAAEFRARLSGGGNTSIRNAPSDDTTVPLSRLTRLADATVAAAPIAVAATTGAENQRGNLVCTVLFLDIVEYSKASVSEQYELKTRFNKLISTQLQMDPAHERITLDTGDGAAICFMGDPEEVLHTALDIRRTLALQDRLRVRMGLHIGPVRILTDLNGRGNVIGDGINSAQRVMSFADEKSLLVSRAFYDVVSCLADHGKEAFRYIGDQQDKHGRVHELYEVILDEGASKLFERTILDLEEDDPGEQIDAAALAAIEQELAHHLGPLAPVLVRKAVGRAASAAQLRELLALSISDPRNREAFREGREWRDKSHPREATQARDGRDAPAHDTSATRRSRPPDPHPATRRAATRVIDPPPPSTSRVPSSSSRSLLPSQSDASMRPWIGPEAIAELEKLLARTVGPLARVLIKTEVRKSHDFAGLLQALSLHIENPQSRTQFMSAAGGLRNLARLDDSRAKDPPTRSNRSTAGLDRTQSFPPGAKGAPDADRVLATVLFTDICDSTLHATRLGDRRWRAILTEHHALVREELARFGGREIDTAGDGFFAVFNGPARAVRCACSIRDAVQTLGIEIRAGLHTGELETVGEKASGIAVHIAARVIALAQPNEVLVSSTVKDLIAGSDIALIDKGHHQLKGFQGDWLLYMAA